jgi:hypothetical protein
LCHFIADKSRVAYIGIACRDGRAVGSGESIGRINDGAKYFDAAKNGGCKYCGVIIGIV